MRAGLTMLLAPVAVAACVAGCGGQSASRPLSSIHLSLSEPADGARFTARSVLLTGTVSPSRATVLVAGRDVAVSGGLFSTRIALTPGQNIIDVLAGAPRAQSAMTAVRVFRQMNVSVPTLSGESVNVATRTLHSVGLGARIVDSEPFYSFLLPGSPSVCSTSPPAERNVPPGTLVTVTVSKTC